MMLLLFAVKMLKRWMSGFHYGGPATLLPPFHFVWKTISPPPSEPLYSAVIASRKGAAS